MSYKIEITRRQESTNGKETRDDIIISKVNIYEGIGGIESVYQQGLISFPTKDLEAVIEQLKEKLT